MSRLELPPEAVDQIVNRWIGGVGREAIVVDKDDDSPRFRYFVERISFDQMTEIRWALEDIPFVLSGNTGAVGLIGRCFRGSEERAVGNPVSGNPSDAKMVFC